MSFLIRGNKEYQVQICKRKTRLVIIHKIGIQNITSILNPLEIELGRRVTILIGPNNSGKSNILESLNYVLNTTQEERVDSEVVNKGALAALDSSEEPEMHQIACIDATLTITDVDRNDAIYEAFRIMKTQCIARYPESEVYWNRFLVQLRDYANVFFPNPMKIQVSVFRKIDSSFHFKSHWDQFQDGIRHEWGIYEKRWQQLFLEQVGPYSKDFHLFQYIQVMYEFLVHRCMDFPRKLPPDRPDTIGQGGLGGKLPTPDRIREYLLYTSESTTRDKAPSYALESIVELVKEVFPDIEDIDPSYDITIGQVKVIIKKKNGDFELGTQGDGLKQLLMAMAFMQNQEENLLIIDEPENHLHPKLEPKIIDFFLNHGKGQLVIATHSETIVSSVPDDAITRGDVVIYGVTLDDDGHTQVKKGSEADIIQFLGDLGIKVSRFMKHMAALSRVILLVEGESDGTIIKKILHRFNRLDEFEQHRPLFVPLGGVEEASKIGRAVVDLIAKGDETLQTPEIPFIVILDRDEKRARKKDYEFILSVREIENLVITEKTISKTLEKFFGKVGVEYNDSNRSLFDMGLAKVIEDYLNKWILLIIKSDLGNIVRPILRKKSTGKRWKITQKEALEELSEEKTLIEDTLQNISNQYTEISIKETYDNLKQQCFDSSGSVNYGFVCANLPGKIFLRQILPEALVGAVKLLHQEEAEFDEDKYRGMAGSVCNVDELLNHCEKFPADMEQLLSKLKE